MPRPRILVVDDHPDIVEYFLFYLRQKGFRRAWAYDGVTALALAKVTKPDLVLLNIQMPRIDGVQDHLEYPARFEDVGVKADRVPAA